MNNRDVTRNARDYQGHLQLIDAGANHHLNPSHQDEGGRAC